MRARGSVPSPKNDVPAAVSGDEEDIGIIKCGNSYGPFKLAGHPGGGGGGGGGQ